MIFCGSKSIVHKPLRNVFSHPISRDTFQSFVTNGEVPNLLLCGTAGIGKTTVAKALCKELGVDSYVINGSDEGRFLDTVRNQCKTVCINCILTSSSKHKVIIIDEADNTTHDVQLLLRASIEEFQNNCRFIFTCNFKNKIIEPLHSRTTVIDCNVRGKNKQQIAAQFLSDVVIFLPEKMYGLIMRWSLRSSRSTSQTSEGHSTNSKGILQRGLSTLAFWRY